MSESSLVRIKLLKHPAGFTGKFANYNFENNVSEPMLRREAERLSVITQVEFLDGAENIIQRRQRERGEIKQVMASKPTKTPQKPVEAPTQPTEKYTREQLEVIADKEGSEGLRKIATPLSVKGRSIRELIDAILKAQ